MPLLSPDDRRTLLTLARRSVVARVTGTTMPSASAGVPDLRADAFVTIRRGGQLRGCIGSVDTAQPIGEVIVRCAGSAAAEDPRFPPVSPVELDDIEIEVSVLGRLEAVDPIDPSAVEVGRHGLVVEQGSRRGLLLPQVASEWNWNAETFLEQTCIKAGLPRDAWRGGARVFRFDAEVFGESEVSG